MNKRPLNQTFWENIKLQMIYEISVVIQNWFSVIMTCFVSKGLKEKTCGTENITEGLESKNGELNSDKQGKHSLVKNFSIKKHHVSILNDIFFGISRLSYPKLFLFLLQSQISSFSVRPIQKVWQTMHHQNKMTPVMWMTWSQTMWKKNEM